MGWEGSWAFKIQRQFLFLPGIKHMLYSIHIQTYMLYMFIFNYACKSGLWGGGRKPRLWSLVWLCFAALIGYLWSLTFLLTSWPVGKSQAAATEHRGISTRGQQGLVDPWRWGVGSFRECHRAAGQSLSAQAHPTTPAKGTKAAPALGIGTSLGMGAGLGWAAMSTSPWKLETSILWRCWLGPEMGS